MARHGRSRLRALGELCLAAALDSLRPAAVVNAMWLAAGSPTSRRRGPTGPMLPPVPTGAPQSRKCAEGAVRPTATDKGE
jgi:hypothetical protein